MEEEVEVMNELLNQANISSSASLPFLLYQATSHPSLFAFSELLALPIFLQLHGTPNSPYLNMLRLFAHGTLSDYKRIADSLPKFMPEQILKLKQLTILTLAETNKVLHYDQLMKELDVTNVRELEDFLINDCLHVGIVKGKLDHLRRCFKVQFAAGRDLRPGQLESMIQKLSNWLSTSENLLFSVQEQINWADNMSAVVKKHRKDVKEKIEEVKKFLPNADVDFEVPDIFNEYGGVMDYGENRSHLKRRRHLVFEKL